MRSNLPKPQDRQIPPWPGGTVQGPLGASRNGGAPSLHLVYIPLLAGAGVVLLQLLAISYFHFLCGNFGLSSGSI